MCIRDRLDTAAAVPVAEKYVSDANWSIRQEAVYAISALTSGQRKDLIYDQLFAGKLPRDGEGIRRRAAIALGELGDARVRDYLVTCYEPVSYTHLRAHETVLDLVCRLLLDKKHNKVLTKLLMLLPARASEQDT